MTRTSILLALALAAGCTATEGTEDGSRSKDPFGKADSSAEATILDFEWDGELLTGSSWNPKNTIEDQLLYTIGHLNGDRSLGRLDKVELTDVQTSSEGGLTRITYHAKMPVAWADPSGVVDTYTFQLPLDMSYSAIGAFAEKYGHDCVDWGAHDVDAGSMWYYYRPARGSCELDEADIVTMPVTVSPSSLQTTGKYPEYHKIWEDDVLRAVAIFGKNEEGATSSDPGISAYDSMSRKLSTLLGPHSLQTIPEDLPSYPGAANPDITFSATLPDGKKVEVVLLLVDGVRVAGPEFDARYESLTRTADFIAYAGHSGLGANIRALANKGDWVTGQYVIVDMNGCDTYAYVDSSLADAHTAVNSDDPNGTKYLDILTNAMPAMFRSNASNITAIIKGLMEHETPKTFEQIFAGVDAYQVILVSGEEDNVYVPGYEGGGGGGGEEDWDGMTESGNVVANAEDRYATPKLAPGTYSFELTGDGDADLYVRVGEAPTSTLYDCRPYRYGSWESCRVELNTAAEIHVMVRGWDDSSDYELAGSTE